MSPVPNALPSLKQNRIKTPHQKPGAVVLVCDSRSGEAEIDSWGLLVVL